MLAFILPTSIFPYIHPINHHLSTYLSLKTGYMLGKMNRTDINSNCYHLAKWVEKTMAPHSSTLAWRISRMEEPGRLQSMGSLRVGHDWATSLSLFTFMHWRRKWQATPVFLPGESQGRGAWRAAVYGVAQSRTRLKRLSSSGSRNRMEREILPHPSLHGVYSRCRNKQEMKGEIREQIWSPYLLCQGYIHSNVIPN